MQLNVAIKIHLEKAMETETDRVEDCELKVPTKRFVACGSDMPFACPIVSFSILA